MSGRHRNEIPGEPGENGHGDSTPPVFGPANDGSSDWFSPRDGVGGTRRPGGAQGTGGQPSGSYELPASSSGGSDVPEWLNPGQSTPPSGYGVGGFSGASDPGGHGLGRAAAPPNGPSAGSSSGALGSGPYDRPFPTGASAVPTPPSASSGGGGSSPYDRPFPTGAGRGSGEAGAFGAYDAISRSDGGPTGPGGSGGSGGYGGGGSGGYGSGDYEYGGRRKKRNLAALIGPMAGAVGLALLLGVGVYAFAGGSGDCSGDDAISLSVAAAPEIEPAISRAVGRFNDSENDVNGHCVKAAVRAAEPAAVSTLLSGQSVPTGNNAKPDVWIPDTSLWASVVGASPKGKNAVRLTKTSVAVSPIVVAMPTALASELQKTGTLAEPSWDNLLGAAGGIAGGGVTKNDLIPQNLVRLYIPDPTRNGAGITTLMITDALLANDPNKASIFTGMVRTVRENTTPSVKSQFASFRQDRKGRHPVLLAPEQAVWQHNRSDPSGPAVAVYPFEGTLNMDYPFTVTTADGDKQKAARLLEQAMNTEPTRGDVRGMGFRSADGKAPSTFGAKTGVSPQRPRQLPAPQANQVAQVMQAWAKLSLSIRMLTLIDISGTMAEEIAPGVNRLQATTRTAQGGLTLLPNDTELGVWEFSTKLKGNQDWREVVSVGPLGERVGSNTRRQLVLSGMGALQPKRTGDTGLFETVMAAYKYMDKSYKPEFGNSILLFTDGKGNDDPGGPSLSYTLKTLRELRDPDRPVQVILIGVGKNVDTREMKQIAGVTGGSVHVAESPQQIQKIFLQALARRIQQ